MYARAYWRTADYAPDYYFASDTLSRGQHTFTYKNWPCGPPDANFSRPHQIPVAHLIIHFFYENLTTYDTFTDSESTHEMQVQ